ncbi:MAG: transglutaminase-like domain-containing protein [bacterium]
MNSSYLKETFYFDYKSPEIQNFISDFSHLSSKKEQIEQLYIKVRDGWRYNAYNIGLTDAHYKASTIYHKKEAHCIDKAILYITGLRGLGIPSRLRLAKVANHIAAERLEAKLGTNELAPHGLVDVYLNNEWKKCSPAFNVELCDMYNVEVLDFDGTEDAIMQEFNKNDAKFMSYIEDYGHFEDVPLERIKSIFKDNYPDFYKAHQNSNEVNF